MGKKNPTINRVRSFPEIHRKNILVFADANAAIESLKKQIVSYQLNESTFTQTVEQINQDLLDAQQDCDELREDNEKLTSSMRQMEQEKHSLQTENQQLQVKLQELEQRPSLSAFQRIDSSKDEIQQLRDELAAASAHCLQLEEANRAWQQYQSDQIESFRRNLQEKMPLHTGDENPSLDFIGQQVVNHLDQLNHQRDELLQQNDLLKADMVLQKKELGNSIRKSNETSLLYLFFRCRSSEFCRWWKTRVS